MAETDFGALSSNQKKIWSAAVYQAGREQSFWLSGNNSFMGKGMADSSKPISYITELTKTERGDQCIMPLVLDLEDDGVVDDFELEGTEEALISDTQTLRIAQLRKAVKNKGKMSDQRTVLRFLDVARNTLGFWQSDLTDQLMFLVASGIGFDKRTDGSSRAATSSLPSLSFNADVTAPSSARILYAGAATSQATLTASDKMSVEGLHRLKAHAMRQRIKPIMSGGRAYYFVVMSTEQERDLKLDPIYRTTLNNAGVRGSNNELFKGGFAEIDGLVLYSAQKVTTTLGLPSGQKWGVGQTVNGARALLVGAQALGYALVQAPEWLEIGRAHV